MTDLLIGIAIGVVAVAALGLIIFLKRSKRQVDVQVHSSLLEMKSVGELTVFKVVTKEIVTAGEHWLGDTGKRYFSWLVSGKKMAMIFEFGIDFKYDLRSSDFRIDEQPDGRVTFHMPACFYETYIRDISFYDEQDSKFLPWLMPDLLSKAFGGGFSEVDKNRLKEEARNQAGSLAEGMVQRIQSEVQTSAEQTLKALAKGFGAKQIKIDFSDSKLLQEGKPELKALPAGQLDALETDG